MKIFKFSVTMLLLVLIFGSCKKELNLLPESQNKLPHATMLQQEFEKQFQSKVDSREKVEKGIWDRIKPVWSKEEIKNLKGETYSVFPIEFLTHK